jgi:zinc/manganese transport system substrate-binding protein
MHMVSRIVVALAMVTVVSACAGAGGSAAGTGLVKVVAAENFYGDIARHVGGRFVGVTSILSDPNADPHLFDPGTTTAALVADADVVIDNGLGYDAWMDRLLAAAPSDHRQVVTIATVLGIHGVGANPHLWYDVPKLPEIARGIAAGLGRADPGHRAVYDAQAAGFIASLRPLNQAVDAIRRTDGGARVAYTEPVPQYLLDAAGLVSDTPADFARAIEEGSEPSPQAVAAMEALLTGRQVRVLLYNSQATSPITQRLQALAEANGIPVVAVTETLPRGRSFVEWQLSQVQALAKALGR